MKAAVLLLLCAFAGASDTFTIHTADGDNVYLTRAAFAKQFPGHAEPSISLDHGMAFGWTNGLYDHASNTCFVIAATPDEPSDLEQAKMLHEIGHRLIRLYGWETARPVWLALAKDWPSLMTHPAINTQICREHLWPSIWHGDF